jgi:hypothetical protein
MMSRDSLRLNSVALATLLLLLTSGCTTSTASGRVSSGDPSHTSKGIEIEDSSAPKKSPPPPPPDSGAEQPQKK